MSSAMQFVRAEKTGSSLSQNFDEIYQAVEKRGRQQTPFQPGVQRIFLLAGMAAIANEDGSRELGCIVNDTIKVFQRSEGDKISSSARVLEI